MNRCIFLIALLTGCASSMSTLQTARTTPKGELDAQLGMGANISSSLIGSIATLGESSADRARRQIEENDTENISDEDTKNLIGAAVSFGLFGPSPVTEIGFRYGILDNWDVGAKYTSAGPRLETKIQLMSQTKNGFDLSVGISGQRQKYEPPVPSFLEDVLQLEDIVRIDVGLQVLAGKHFGDYAFVYGGPKFVYTNLELNLVQQINEASPDSVTVDDGFLMGGAVVGGGLGWKYVFFMLELNALYYSYDAEILGTSVTISGIDFYPTLGMHVQFYSL